MIDKNPTTPDELFSSDIINEQNLDGVLDDDGELIDMIMDKETKNKNIFSDEDE